MQNHGLQVGQIVRFGRPNGQQTLGKITKLNPTKAKITILETRDNDYPIGGIWAVPYSLITPTTMNEGSGGGGSSAPTPSLAVLPPVYSPYAAEDNQLMDMILGVYVGLSPESLSCDGEATHTWISHRRAELGRKLRGLCLALGRNVSESEAYAWDRARRDFLANHKNGIAAAV